MIDFHRLWPAFVLALATGLSSCAAVSAADVEQQAQQILGATGVQGGLVVHLGCGDGRLTAALRANAGYLVQGLDVDAANVEKARAYLRSAGLQGPVTVDRYDGAHLPYTDSLVKLLVADDRRQVSQQEMLRVLAPLGKAYVRDGSGWKTIARPWPKEIDQWTHYLHAPDNNAVARDTAIGPPRQMQWLAEPLWTRNHHKLNSISAVVTAAGRLFVIGDEAPAANVTLPSKWAITARDAFSGVLLWRQPIPSWASHQIGFRSGPPQLPRLLVASADRVYLPLGLSAPVSQLDAATGKTLQTYEPTRGAEELILAGDILVVLKGAPVAAQAVRHKLFQQDLILPNRKSIVAVDVATGAALWSWTEAPAPIRPETLACDGQRVYAQVGEGVACLDMKFGKKLWTYGESAQKPAGKQGKQAKKGGKAGPTFGTYTLVVADGVVLCNLAGRLTALAADDGKKLWECESGTGFHSPADVFVIDGLVWQGVHERDSVAPPPVNDFNEGRDLKTGEVRSRNQVMVDLQTAGHHHRCYREKATTRYIIAGKRGMEMMDLAGDDHSRNNWVRGTCQYGILPANGLLYAPPHSCGCYMESKLFGFWALAPDRPGGAEATPRIDDGQRLEKGPGFRVQGLGLPSSPLSPPSSLLPTNPQSLSSDWPTYRHDSLRSGKASTTVPANVEQAWTARVGGRLTQPVIAGGKVLVASVDQNTLYALDETNGSVAWTYTAGGRVDSPPTIHEGLVLLGSADGRVACLRLADGQLVWRFLAAPADRRAVACDQVESLWPVHGSILVLNGVAYCAAGRSTWLDGGIDLYGLDPASGAVVSRFHFQSQHPPYQEGKDRAKPEQDVKVSQNIADYRTFTASDRSDSFSMAAGAVSDVLVSDGRDVFLHHVRFSAALERQDQMARHLFSTSSLLDDTENHRSHWVLGTGDFSRIPVSYSWIVDRAEKAGSLAVPTGVMMVFDEHTVWGARRKGDANGQYQLFSRKNAPFAAKETPLPDLREVPKGARSDVLWRIDLPVRTRAMVKAGEHLILGTMPVEVAAETPNASGGPKGGAVWVVSARDGAKIGEFPTPSPPVWDGLAVAHERIYLSTVGGQVLCFAGKR